jgi:DNA replication and repair protein RecF
VIAVKKLVLTNFRNFHSKKIDFSSNLVLLAGANGVGKTNILESLTLLGHNSYLRSVNFEEMISEDQKTQKKQQQFGIYAEISGHEFIEKIGVSFDLKQKKKLFEINEESFNSKRQSHNKNHLINFIFLTPQLEQLFILGKSERRSYLDKIVSDLDFEHAKRVNNYHKLLKERLLILQKYYTKKSAGKWLQAIENQIVELGLAIASARIEAIDFFNKAIASFASNFPRPKLQVIGNIEELVMKQSSVRLEEFYKKQLQENQTSDLKNFRTGFGVHRSDFDAVFVEKNALATRCSTGEQKSIMIGISLARAKISARYKNQPTILIFDEIVSHLDEKRKNNLFAEISDTSLQSFFSATTIDLIPSDYIINKSMQIVEL